MKLELPLTTEIKTLGECEFISPLKVKRFVQDGRRRAVHTDLDHLRESFSDGGEPPSFEAAGPREKLYFQPGVAKAGIVTCGGLCPGLNDVIRAIVMSLYHDYGCKEIYGFRYGYSGITHDSEVQPVVLTPDSVPNIHNDGGTILGSSRGNPGTDKICDYLIDNEFNMLFTIGGDGTLKGSHDIAETCAARGYKISVIGIPKTIDNDILFISRTFGFSTAIEEARRCIEAAHNEAKGAQGGIGILKLMGRDSGFIAAEACLSNNNVNFCLIPEADFDLEGDKGLLKAVKKRLNAKKSTVIVVAEGAGQKFFEEGKEIKDASGNVLKKDIGTYLRDIIKDYLKSEGFKPSIKYIDPSYIIRSLPADAQDSSFCLLLGQYACHAAMSGRTDMIISSWQDHMVHIPIETATSHRKVIDTDSSYWLSVRYATGQPDLKN